MAVAMWVRATWRLVVPAMAVAQLAVLYNVQPVDGVPFGWRVDWGWMLSVWSGATLLMSPAGAAVVVALVLVNLGPEVQEGLPASVPRWRPVAHVSAAVAVQGLAVQVVALGVCSLVCWVNAADPRGVTLPWQVLTGPAALVAGISVGAAVALLIPSYWSIPGVLFGLFVGHRVFFWNGWPELFTTEMATWMVTGGRPIPRLMLATVELNAVTSVGIWAGLIFLVQRLPRRPWVALVVCLLAIGAAATIYLPFVLADAMDTYEPVP